MNLPASGFKSTPKRKEASLASPLAEGSSSSRRERKRCLDLRGRVVLSADGARFFLPRVPGLHRFEGAEGETRFGFRLRSIDVPWLRKLLLSNFVDKAEFPVRDVSAVKNEITDLSRLVVFSLLYGRFNSAVLARSIETEVIQRWNRQHPHRALSAANAASPAELRAAMETRTEAISAVKKAVCQPILHALAADARRNPDDIARLSLFVRDLLDKLDPLAYFVLLGSSSEERASLTNDIGRELTASLEKSDLADYLVLMVLELMGAAERTTLIDMLGHGVAPETLRAALEDPQKRRELLSRLPNGLAASMVWSISRRWALGRWRYRLRLSLHDGTSSFEDTKRLFEERARLDVGDRNLKEFYEQGSGPYGDDGLGWYYLSFLADACSAIGVRFEASVREKPDKGTAAVNLVFVF